MFQFLNAHKTKIVGGLIVISGALQANSTAVQSLLSPREYAWFTVGIGVVVAILGFLNSQNKS